MFNSLTHRLQDAQTGKTCTLTLAATTLTTTTGQPGRGRTAEKAFATAEEARKQLEKKEWELLKKGFVLYHEHAQLGEPLLHCYVGPGYTGCLALVGTPQGTYVYKHGWYGTAHDQVDFLVRLTDAGQLLETIQLPQVLPWDMQYNAATDSLLLNLDHSVYAYYLATGKFQQLAPRTTQLGSHWSAFVAVGRNQLAFASEPTLYVQTLDHQPLLELTYASSIRNGTRVFAAALAKGGELVALHCQPGEIQLLHATTGTQLRTLTGSFTQAQQLEFVAHDALLVVRTHDFATPLLFFDVASGQPVPVAGLELPNQWQRLRQFCFNADESRLVLLANTTAYVFDFNRKCLLYSFPLQHAVKTAQLKFIGDVLGVRTDYGCFSRYTL